MRRDLLLRHDRTVHAKDGGVPLHSDGKRRGGPKAKAAAAAAAAAPVAVKHEMGFDDAVLEQMAGSGEDALDVVEAATMLITDLHHNAHAMMQNNGGFGTGRGATFGQSDNSMMDPPTVTYPNGAIGLPPQWDFGSDGKNHPMSNNGTFNSQQSLASASTIQPQHNSMYARQINGPESTASYSMANSIRTSATGTPVSQSSHASQSTHADAHQTSAGFNTPQVYTDEERNVILDSIRASDASRAIPESFRLPNLSSLNRYLSTYFNLFYHHLPFLHPNSFEPTNVSPALLLAALSIGALYAFDQEQAFSLHVGSKILVDQFLQNKEDFSSRKCPLWAMQSSLLNIIFASWSGVTKGLEWSCSIKSLLANMVAGNRYELKLRQEAREGHPPTRAQWVEDEECRRTYYAVYIFFGLQTMSFNHSPGMGFNELADLLLPSTEAIWNMKVTDEVSWQEHLSASTCVTLMDAHSQLFQGEEIRYSAFATRVMINALFLEIWYHKRSPEALQDVFTEYKLRLALETWEKSLELCEPEPATVPVNSPHEGHPLTFNAMAMCRSARVRLEVDLKDCQEALRYHNTFEVAGQMTRARDSVKRSAEMTKAIQECYDCIETAVRQGLRWVARISPTNWSIEHPLCGMDLMVVLSLWLYRLEHDEEPATADEMAMYNRIRLLFEKDLDQQDITQLGTVVARLWGSMLDEVVVWG